MHASLHAPPLISMYAPTLQNSCSTPTRADSTITTPPRSSSPASAAFSARHIILVTWAMAWTNDVLPLMPLNATYQPPLPPQKPHSTKQNDSPSQQAQAKPPSCPPSSHVPMPKMKPIALISSIRLSSVQKKAPQKPSL